MILQSIIFQNRERYPSQNDISLVQTASNMGSQGSRYPYMPICMSGNQLAFETGVGTVGGWGKKHRNDKTQMCRTTGHGPAPFKKCRLPFRWKGKEYNYCSTQLDPPVTVGCPVTRFFFKPSVVFKFIASFCNATNGEQFSLDEIDKRILDEMSQKFLTIFAAFWKTANKLRENPG